MNQTVLFVCVHNAGRSQMAAGYLRHLAGDRIEVLSAGSEPADQVNTVAVAAMAEEGIDIAGVQPRILTTDAVQHSDVVITMGCGDACPFYPGKRYEDWKLDDPAGQGIDAVRLIRDDIKRRVVELIDSLTAPLTIRPLTAADWPAVEVIYRAGIATGHATFEAEPPTWERFDQTRLPDQRLVAVDPAGRVLGWAAASAVSDRCVYAGVVEHSVYVAPDARGCGVGGRLLDALAESTEAAGIWTIQSGIFPENTASLALHERAGFRAVGTRERVGRMTYGPLEGQWRDVVLVERRSTVAGVSD